jgi:hypothetical protein
MIGLLGCAFVFTGVLALVLFSFRRKGSSSVASQTRALGSFFHERVIHFRSQIQTLDAHSKEYTAVFSNGDWESLSYTIAHLEQVDAQIQGLIVTKQYQKAYSMLKDLYDPNNATLESIQAGIDLHKATAEWEFQVRAMLKRVVQNLEAASTEVSALAGSQKRKKTSTLVTLADVKKRLLEDEAISRELQ